MMKKVDSFVRLDILEEHKRSTMSILSDWEIKHLVEKENMIEPFVAKEVKELMVRNSELWVKFLWL